MYRLRPTRAQAIEALHGTDFQKAGFSDLDICAARAAIDAALQEAKS